MILRVRLNNETEWNMTEKLLFLFGYKWSGFEDRNHIVYNARSNGYISVWEEGYLKYGSSPNYYLDHLDITFDKFIDYIEQNDIKIGEPHDVSLSNYPDLRFDELGNIIPVKDENGGVYSSYWGTYM